MEREKAREYNRIKLAVTFSGMGLELFFWLLVIFAGIAGNAAQLARGLFDAPLPRFYFFAALLGLTHLFINFPLSFYAGYLLEHRFELSNQRPAQWLWEQLKGLLVGLVLGVVLLTIFYLLLRAFPGGWWLGLWLFILLFSVLLSRLAPVLIFPLFYKFIPLENPNLKERMYKLARTWGLKVTGIYQFNLSKTTKKANAAFTGLGKSKRVILADTLLANFSEDEIETVFAHELGHYHKKHLLKGIVFNSLLSLAGIYLVYLSYGAVTAALQMPAHRLEALPWLGLLFFIYGLISEPVSNGLSRRYEYQADRFAVSVTGLKESYISMLRKLSDLNLSDEHPHPLVEALLHSHPSVQHRIAKISGE